MSNRIVLAIDPGSQKCGLALVSFPPLCVLARQVSATKQAVEAAAALLQPHAEACVVLGRGTGSARLQAALAAAFPERSLHIVDEHKSSERARARYCRENPARSWRRLLPAGLRTPESPYDDYVAIELAEAFLLYNP